MDLLTAIFLGVLLGTFILAAAIVHAAIRRSQD